LIRYLRHQDIDKAKWDECINKSLNSFIYAYSWYLDIVCPGWGCLAEGDYMTVFPLTARTKFGISYLYQPYFTQQLGVFSQSPVSEVNIRDFLNSIPSEFKFIEICVNNDISKLKSRKSKVKSNLNLELDLNKSYQDIYENYSTNAKRNLGKASKASITLKKLTDIDLIIDLFSNNKGKEINNLKKCHYLTLKNLVKVCVEKGRGIIYGVYTSENKLCAGMVILKSGKRNIFLFSGSDEISRNNGAMFFMIDNLIKELAGRNEILDFEGSNDKNLANFYKGFGAKEKFYYLIMKNSLPLHIRIFFKIYKYLRK
jgi:hypothetical protein